MNLNTMRHRVLTNVINEHRVFEMFFADRPICSIDNEMLKKGIELEERADLARTGMHRVRFLAKHDRSKYMPHVGAKQLAKAVR